MTREKPNLLAKFRDILKLQLDYYIKVLDAANKKTHVLVNGDVEKLEQITTEEQALIVKLGKLEESREEVLGKISHRYGEDPEDLKEDFFSQILPEDQAQEFTDTCKNLREILDKLTHVNKTNEELIKRALDYINFSIDLLTDASTDTSSYSSDGASSQNKAYQFIDRKA